jgi:hypothetical protein
MPKKDSCKKTHVQIKDGCKLIRRVVYTDKETKEKYIWRNKIDVPLQKIRGQFRYTE